VTRIRLTVNNRRLVAFVLFRSNRTLWLPKANAGTSAIFRDELDAGRFQCLPQLYDGSFLCRELTRLSFKALY
jgi:hypothetical protein